MKIIDLLNKIANGEEVPKKIKYDDDIYEYDYDEKNYAHFFIDHYNYLFDEDIMQILDNKVEILEEEKKIPEKLGECAYVDGEIAYSWSKSEAILKTRINDIIDYLDYLKSKGE